ncbi:golgin candidate 4-like [Selaginella moellendorffii]|uniref:golgin candidate 4-like n=1 Tax=Selaginella moellendorffii TaxID=88036 RepID=UPI000D1CBBF8|nr:golgin candidate 4-like [Selaginella moellendorffii]|eukprot:XP_024534611.1 golgin candidate 4-like [Selaginella moellendorffii]
MWKNFKENLSQMASEVLETVEELDPKAHREEDEEGDSSPAVSGSSRSQQAGRGFHSRRRSEDGFQNFDHRSWRNRDYKERNGVGADDFGDYESRLLESQRKCQDLANREKELLDQMRGKEQAFRDLDNSHRTAQQELERLTIELEKARLELHSFQQSGSLGNHDERTATQPDAEKLQRELQERDETISQIRESISALTTERSLFQAEKEQLKKALDSRELELQQQAASAEKTTSEPEVFQIEMLRAQAQQADVLSVQLQTAEEILENERNDSRKKLEAVTLEKDKALNNLNRLKQHLLDKENADSEKMDRDSEQIAILEGKFSATCARVIQLEQALAQALSSQTDTSKRLNEDLQASKVEIESLKSKLVNSYSVLEARNKEIANLQVALGQYYAETDAKERLQRELNTAKEDLRKFSDSLEAAKRMVEVVEAQKKEAVEKLHIEERKGLENQQKTQKMQEDMIRLRRALEESMIRLNRMSSDSDYSVDRRIVIKLLVTYFERGHNREVLDLMARMLGFSDDDKRRVGLAHQNSGKPGVMRSVFGLPGRVVGGILSGGNDNSSFTTSNDQSFADLWIDFLLKESEEREKAQNSGLAARSPQSDFHSSAFNTGFESDGGLEADISGVRGHRRVYSKS